MEIKQFTPDDQFFDGLTEKFAGQMISLEPNDVTY